MSTILELKNVHKSFDIGTANENHVLKGIDLEIEDNDFISVIGGNGAGKSTLLNVISGAYSVEEGEIILDGQDVTHLPTYQRASFISRVFQDTKMGTATRLSIEENLSVAMKRGDKRTLSRGTKDSQRDLFKRELARLDLGLENRLGMETGLLSGGQRQALTLLMATIVPPKVLLLDEHTAALDPKTSEMVMDLTREVIAEKHLTTLMITHNMEQAIEHGNRLIMMDNGRIVVDISGSEKENLTVVDLLELFKRESGRALSDDSLILG